MGTSSWPGSQICWASFYSSGTVLCRTGQTKAAERLLLGNGPAHDVNGPHMTAQGPICDSYICQGVRCKLHLSPLLYIWGPNGSRGLPLGPLKVGSHFECLRCPPPIPLLLGRVLSPITFSNTTYSELFTIYVD